MVRTRFAPSPTGYLHIGGARTALFSWAYAQKNGGTFILRIEDTDQERSTDASIQVILEGMQWLNLPFQEGPFYQMQRIERYQKIALDLVNRGLAYPCYASIEELNTLREEQRQKGEKPRYDGRWRDSNLTPPAGVKPVIRFKTPQEGSITFTDLVKGTITVHNSELDDLVLLRADGIPTYNFGVVIDDLDMGITHVIRGDDHVNNTPRQIHLFQALDGHLPEFAHLPMILGTDGERLSKRHGAVNLLHYRDTGYLPEALLNYLARLGWSHGDAEVFNREQFIEWFDLKHISHSPARFNPEKLHWVNQQHIKNTPAHELIQHLPDNWRKNIPAEPDLLSVIDLVKGRAEDTHSLVSQADTFLNPQLEKNGALFHEYLTPHRLPMLRQLLQKLIIIEWNKETLNQVFKEITQEQKIKMAELGMPLRVALCGTPQTPSLDATLAVLGRRLVLARLTAAIEAIQEPSLD